MPHIIVVRATFDEEAGVWCTESVDLPGLRIEAPTFEALQERLPGAIADLLEDCEGDEGHDDIEVPVELFATASSRVRVRAYA
ncbi:MAG TPA: DUF1902 domain-containing protein [Caulobacteraceae bacterium]|jgi:hypothetical protein